MPESRVGRKIAVGREAEVFEWRDDTAGRRLLKLYFHGDEASAERALERESAIHDSGLPAPAVFPGVVAHLDRWGFVMERIDGAEMLAEMAKRPWRLVDFGRRLGRLHAFIHTRKVSGLPNLKAELAAVLPQIEPLTVSEKDQLLQILTSLPDGTNTLHGDFHPGNVMIGNADECRSWVIDWSNALTGDPMADVARTQILIEEGWRTSTNAFARALGRWLARPFERAYTEGYFAHADAARLADVEQWKMVIAAARIAEDFEDAPHVLAYVRGHLRERPRV